MPITDLDTLKAFLDENSIRPNRALGQNFFIDGARMAAIADAAEVTGQNVLEIGPGPGALTELLIPRAKRVIAVEKDANMASLLRTRLSGADNLTVETADILRFNVPAAFPDEDFIAAGNLPYYITTPISERLLKYAPASITIMVQKEAAERFTAAPADRVYGPLAVISQVLYAPTQLMDIPRSCYYPQPDVDSAVVRLVRRDGTTAESVKAFSAFLSQCFLMRRKTLYNNLGRSEQAAEAIHALGKDPAVRAEALTPEELYSLYLALNY